MHHLPHRPLLHRTAPALALGALVLAAPSALGLLAGSSATAATAPPEGLLCNGVAPTQWATANGQHVVGTAGPDVIAANGFRDLTIDGGGGNDVICGSTLPGVVATGNALVGGAGDDVLISSGGRERLIGGAGNDRLIGTTNDDVDTSTDGYTSGATGVRVDLTAGTITGARSGTDTLTGLAQARIFGSAGADTFLGDESANWFDGGAGADVIRGNGGNDWIHAVAPASADGGAGDDTLTVGYGGLVRGGTGNDVLAADPNNTLSGASPDRGTVTGYRLNGQGGDDTLEVNTLMTGPTAWSTAAEQRWKGALYGGHGRNTLDLRWLGTQGATVSLVAGTASWPTGAAALSGIQRVIGTAGPDTLFGSPSADTLVGLAGNDRLRGKQGADRLQGNAGDDRLLGGYGSDRTTGGRGTDTCRAEARFTCER